LRHEHVSIPCGNTYTTPARPQPCVGRDPLKVHVPVFHRGEVTDPRRLSNSSRFGSGRDGSSFRLGAISFIDARSGGPHMEDFLSHTQVDTVHERASIKLLCQNAAADLGRRWMPLDQFGQQKIRHGRRCLVLQLRNFAGGRRCSSKAPQHFIGEAKAPRTDLGSSETAR